MNRLSIRPFFIALCGALVCSMGANLVSAEEEAPFPKIERVNQEEETGENSNGMLSLMDAIGYADDSVYLQRIHDNGYYHLVAFSDNGDRVQLHDASKWEVQYSGRQKVLRWVQSDNIFIKPCVSWFSSYKYVLHNRTLNEVVEVNFKESPLPMGMYTLCITNIEPSTGLVLLNNNTVWQMGTNFSQWRIGQRVVVGVNNKWRTAAYPHILINIDISGQPYSESLFYGYPAGY